MNYIGNKGFSIYKTSLNETQEKKIKKDLVVKPLFQKVLVNLYIIKIISNLQYIESL